MRTNRTPTVAALLLALCAAPGLDASDGKGYLYGTVQTKGGTTYEGRLRWGNEEAFWTDHFNATKEDRPLAKEIPRRHRGSDEPMRVFGVPIGIRWSEDSSRQLVVRFGDLKAILPDGSDGVTIVLKDGEKMRLGGGSNDVGARVTVHDATLGEIRVPWEKIRRVDFKAAPAELPGAPARLFGTVKTEAGTFRGPVQWDKEECLATDVLDGTSEDGKMKIEMGKIQAIEREGFRASRVFLRDGREVVLRGTNDVDDDNRGIFVDDPRYGRVLVSWEAFRRADFEDGGSGPGYDDFPPPGPLRGTLTTREGKALKGHVVFDVDESRGWEMLDGDYDGITYSIPFAEVASVAPSGSRRARVTLRGTKEELALEDSADVTDRNAGVFVLSGERKTYVPWDEVSRIDFER
jgi:sporulation protein YlmC with PRC-barrel domain